MMKDAFVSTIVGIILFVLLFWLGGCGYVAKTGTFAGQLVAGVLALGSEPDEAYAQLGETEAEGRRRHLRNERINQRELMADIDRLLLLDQPSRLTDRRIP